MIGRHRDRRHGLLEGFVQHARARDLRCHGVELVARQRERVDLAAFEQAEDFIVGLVARDLGILQMRDRAAHRGRVIDRGDLDAGLIERCEIRTCEPGLTM